jgi:hypothetical protein
LIGPGVASATIQGERERSMKAAQERPDSRAGVDEGRSSALLKEMNIRSKVKGIALAKANPSLPRSTVDLGSWAERAEEMLNVQAAIAAADRAKRRLTGACGFWRTTKEASVMRVRARSAVPRVSMLVLTGMTLRSNPAHH